MSATVQRRPGIVTIQRTTDSEKKFPAEGVKFNYNLNAVLFDKVSIKKIKDQSDETKSLEGPLSIRCAVNKVSNFDGNLRFVGKRVEFGSEKGCFGAVLHRQNENNQNLIFESRMPLLSEISFIILLRPRPSSNNETRRNE